MAKKRKSNIMKTRVTNINPETVARGKAYTEAFLKKYGDTPLSQIEGMDTVGTVSTTWEERPRSNIVKWLMDKSGRSLEDIAAGLGCSVSYLNNKLHRDSFSLDDMIITSYVCGFALTFTSNDQDESKRCTYQIDVIDYFGSRDEEALARLYAYEKGLREQKKAEYEKMKAQLAQMQEEYGFED